ncbi:MAG: peroxiredoxin [Alphaproteobacteria bacterium]|nr:peroxiredoxin [Alphaproteobacteria bacterium]
MAIKVGDRIPSVTFKQKTADGMKDVKSDEYFKGRKVALFAVPGAFTPTCSAKHLPNYVERASDLKKKGVAEIACVSVNDAFVMEAWGKAQNVGESVTMLGDGNGDFARATGLTLDGRGFGLGERTTRFSMLVDNGVVKVLNVEGNPGEMKESSADKLLSQI